MGAVAAVILCVLLSILAVLILETRKRADCLITEPPHEGNESNIASAADNELRSYKTLYFKLHNFEQHPKILPEAKSLLISFLSGAEEFEKAQETESLIMSIKSPSASSLESLVLSEFQRVTQSWHKYPGRRKEGQPRELFQDFDDARQWLIRQAPLRLVDGAWLGHVHKITTPFAYRKITKSAWQVLSEELGDGDLGKCHAHVFAELLKKMETPVPDPDSEAFLRDMRMDQLPVWRSALAQLLISLFPNDFLPEILGFNLDFEMLTVETLLAAKELKEVGVDPSYFTLHITIDNADSGHTAMARRIVAEFSELEASLHGEAAMQRAWRRVQAGYLLSKNIHKLPPACASRRKDIENSVIELFVAKSSACHGIHEHCSVRIGGRSLSTWLEPSSMRNHAWQIDFLQSLANSRPWVYKGDSNRSRLVQQISWGGSMFGAFTDREVSVVKRWIDSLGSPGAGSYESFTGNNQEMSESIARETSLPVTLLDFEKGTAASTRAGQALDMSRVNIPKLLPLWLAHSCLLESAVSIPWNVSNSVGAAIVRLLRAQYGFLPEPVGVNGLDEMSRDDNVDLVDVGLEMLARYQPGSAVPASLEEALRLWPSPSTQTMLAAAAQPRKLQWVLLGMTEAFTELHESVVKSGDLLSLKKKTALRSIAERERTGLEHCRMHCQADGHGAAGREYDQGYSLALNGIRACFDQD